jgi:hypothetical protein
MKWDGLEGKVMDGMYTVGEKRTIKTSTMLVIRYSHIVMVKCSSPRSFPIAWTTFYFIVREQNP